jgi:ATP-dependent Clp protease adaptor protein ClpS
MRPYLWSGGRLRIPAPLPSAKDKEHVIVGALRSNSSRHFPRRLHAVPVRAAKETRRGGDGAGTAVITRAKTQTKKPSMYRVLLLNDDYTPMEFVVAVLRKYFNKSAEEATHIMLHVHHHGVGECGVFTYEVAETKVTQVMDFARKNQHPLQCIMEKK